ncbi:MAG: protein kinase [Bacteroidota bacterium]
MPRHAPMDATRWTLVRSIFEQAADRPRDEREALLAEACADDVALRREVDSLLSAHDDETPFLDDALATAAWRLLDEPEAEQVGLRIGPYKLLREVGRGGMGLVYLAERDDGQFEQRVAVKLVRQGHLRHDLVRRFHHERRVLATLQHEGIARLLDGGVTNPLPGAPDGLPYLVMEYVEGEPITTYCDRHDLGIRERLELFREVCAAVRYAHQNLVVHRDLKPSNILVEDQGGGATHHPARRNREAQDRPEASPTRRPRVKLLDFGIAKLLDAPDADPVLTARTGLRALTPTYAAPEQIRHQPVTPAADVYALGVLLFELLASTRPYDVTDLSPSEVERVVCETEPPRVSDSAPPKRQRTLRGDLDTIVAKALRKEPERRYALAADLDEDIRRYLAQLPIRARPDTATYRASRFVRRHAVGVGATVLLVLTLLGGLLATARQARIADERTREVRQLAGTLLFEVHDAIRDLPGATRARETLISNALAYLDGLWQDRPNDPDLQHELADAYAQIAQIQGHPYTTNLGDLDGAERSYRRALDLRLALWAEDSTDDDLRHDLAVTYRDLSAVIGWAGSEEALPMQRRAMALLAPLLARDAPDVRHDAARLRSEYGWSTIFDSRYEQGLADVEAAIAVLERLAAQRPDDLQLHIDLWRAYSYRADGLSFSGRHEQVLELMETRGLPLLDRLLRRYPNHSRLLYGLHIGHNYVGSSLQGTGRPREALDSREASLRYAEAMLAVDTTDQKSQEAVGRSLNGLAQSYAAEGEVDEAARLYRRAIALAQARYDEDPTNIEAGNRLSLAYRFLCRALADAERYADALAACMPSIEIQEQVAEDLTTGVFVGNLGSAYGHTARIHRAMAERVGTVGARQHHTAEALRYYALSLDVLEAVEAAKAGQDANWEVHPESLRVEQAALRRAPD